MHVPLGVGGGSHPPLLVSQSCVAAADPLGTGVELGAVRAAFGVAAGVTANDRMFKLTPIITANLRPPC